MEKFDLVELINDNEELSAKNIFKGIHGILVSYISSTDKWIVMYLDDYNYGAYAVAETNATGLKYFAKMPLEQLNEFLEQINSPDFYSHTELKPPKFKEYDHVRLIVDKSKYEKKGLKKDMDGYIASTYAIRGNWQVLFPVEPWRDVDIDVHEDDLELID